MLFPLQAKDYSNYFKPHPLAMAITGHRRSNAVEVLPLEDGFTLTSAMQNVADFPEHVEAAVGGLVLRPGTYSAV